MLSNTHPRNLPVGLLAFFGLMPFWTLERSWKHIQTAANTRCLMHLNTAHETYNFSFGQRILLLPWMQGHCFFKGFLILVHISSSLIIAAKKHTLLVRHFCYSCVILTNCSIQTYLATIPVFSAFFILTFSLTGTFFSVADAVRSCRMGPIALNTMKWTGAVLKLSALPQNVPFVSAYTHRATEKHHRRNAAAKYQRHSSYIFQFAKNWSNPLNSVEQTIFNVNI